MVSMNLRRPKSIFNFPLGLGGASSKSVTQELGEDDIIIATLGSIGTGKSNFIDHLVNANTVDSMSSPLASPGLVSPSTALKGREIKPVRIYDHHTYGNRLVLLDTPGYDDINFVEADVLRMIKTFLKKSSRSDSDLLLSGIISFHRISDNRSPERQQNLNVGLFSGLCAGGGLKRVVFATTMWDKANGDEKKRQVFEKRMMGYRSHWDTLIQAGATQTRFNNTPEAAWGVISSILSSSQHTSSPDLIPFPCADSPRTPHDSNSRNDDSPSTNSWTTLSTPTFSNASSKAAASKTDASVELPLFSPISPISATMDRTFPVVSISEEASSSPISPLNAPAVPSQKLPNAGFSKLPGSTRPRLNVDFPRQISRQTSRASGDCYAHTPCPLSPNTSDMWLLADRVYLAGSLSERMAFS